MDHQLLPKFSKRSPTPPKILGGVGLHLLNFGKVKLNSCVIYAHGFQRMFKKVTDDYCQYDMTSEVLSSEEEESSSTEE